MFDFSIRQWGSTTRKVFCPQSFWSPVGSSHSWKWPFSSFIGISFSFYQWDVKSTTSSKLNAESMCMYIMCLHDMRASVHKFMYQWFIGQVMWYWLENGTCFVSIIHCRQQDFVKKWKGCAYCFCLWGLFLKSTY